MLHGTHSLEVCPFSLGFVPEQPFPPTTHCFLQWWHHEFWAGHLHRWLRQQLGLQFHERGARNLNVPGERERVAGGGPVGMGQPDPKPPWFEEGEGAE